MRPFTVAVMFFACLLFAGSAFAGGFTCPTDGGALSVPTITDGPLCSEGQCHVTRQPVRTALKKIARPFKTIRDRRAHGHRWIDRCGHRGPRRFAQRLRGWRPFQLMRARRCL